ncbi:MAG TPA: ester cyclase, partial [Isosphaeraceae bacterium]|nr:ester cyclase [Isosphaeraceae bacterium]
DQVVVRWKAFGHHAGEGLGCTPTHQPITFQGISWIQVKDGKFGEGWQSSNITEIVRSLASPSS